MMITKDNYFNKEVESIYMGSTSIKNWDNNHKGFKFFNAFIEGGCEAREVAIQGGEYEKEDKEAFLVGGYVHAWLEGKDAFQEFISENSDSIYKKRGGGMYAPFERADLMIDTLKKSELVMDMANCQKEQIFTGEIAGQKIKIRVDLLDLERGYFADLKTTDDLEAVKFINGEKKTFIEAFDYELQWAIYSEILYQNLGTYLDFYIIVVDKQPIPALEVIYMGNQKDSEKVQEKLDEIELIMPRIQLVRSGKADPIGCGKCKYCRSKKVVSEPISFYEYRKKLGLE